MTTDGNDNASTPPNEGDLRRYLALAQGAEPRAERGRTVPILIAAYGWCAMFKWTPSTERAHANAPSEGGA